MAAKADAKEKSEPAPAPEKGAAAPAPAEQGGKAPSAAGALLRTWLPAFIAVLLAPVASWSVAEFVLLPRLQKKLAAAPAGAAGMAHHESEGSEGSSGEKGHGEGKEGGGSGNYDFSNVVVNLAGTMGTRYLKTSFVVTPAEKGANLKGVFEGQKAKLTDITLNVLSSLTLADLEEPGAKNVLREKLVAAYNQALGKRAVEQVYFSDFVIQ